MLSKLVNRLKILFPLIFLLSGVFFLLVAIPLFPSIMQYLEDWSLKIEDFPPAWDLDMVGAIIRGIFVTVGVFLTGFGILLLAIRNRIDWFKIWR